MKECPFCAEEIQDAAIKCKHCGSDLTEKLIRTTELRSPVRTIDERKGNSISLKIVGIVLMVVGLLAVIVTGGYSLILFLVGFFVAVAGRAQD